MASIGLGCNAASGDSMSAPTAKTVALVWVRDRGACARCGKAVRGERGRDWSVHHRRPRGSGGTSLDWPNLPANLLILCGSGTTGCHGWIESHRDEARNAGFLVRLLGTEPASHVPILHARLGRCLLDDVGGYENTATVVF